MSNIFAKPVENGKSTYTFSEEDIKSNGIKLAPLYIIGKFSELPII